MHFKDIQKNYILYFDTRGEVKKRTMGRVKEIFPGVEQFCVELPDGKLTILDYSRVISYDWVPDAFYFARVVKELNN